MGDITKLNVKGKAENANESHTVFKEEADTWVI